MQDFGPLAGEDAACIHARDGPALCLGLSDVMEGVTQAYPYPLRDLITHMQSAAEDVLHRALKVDGEVTKYLLHFRSPEYTWKMLCGREGIYTVSAETLSFEKYDMIKMN